MATTLERGYGPSDLVSVGTHETRLRSSSQAKRRVGYRMHSRVCYYKRGWKSALCAEARRNAQDGSTRELKQKGTANRCSGGCFLKVNDSHLNKESNPTIGKPTFLVNWVFLYGLAHFRRTDKEQR